MTRDEALEILAQERGCSAEDIHKFSCDIRNCDAEPCVRIRKLMAQPLPVSTDTGQEKRLRGVLDRSKALVELPSGDVVTAPIGDDAVEGPGEEDGPWAEGWNERSGEDYHAIIARKIGILPDDDTARLDYPLFDGLLAYFPSALAEVARVSKIGNDQQNVGQPLHWARTKSTDHANKIARHLLEHGTKDNRGVRHSARLAWRALALLQVELEREEGAPFPRNCKF